MHMQGVCIVWLEAWTSIEGTTLRPQLEYERKAKAEHDALRVGCQQPYRLVCASGGQDVLAVWVERQAVHLCVVCFMLLYQTCSNRHMQGSHAVCMLPEVCCAC